MNFDHAQLNPHDAWRTFQPTTADPWSNRKAAHLLRRAGFGGTIEQIVAAQKLGPEKALDQLFDLEAAEKYDRDMETAGRLVTTGTDSKNLAAWWLLRMLKTPHPLQEKMTLFWHGHFATGADKVNDARAMLRQNVLLRKHCLAQFQPLVKQLSRDVAMLIYLDSTENRKTRPNENYARELMELFCLGPGNYGESDIKAVARCFTGWEIRHHQFQFNAYQHDEGVKSFLGASGNFDGDDAIDAIIQCPAAATFIAKKLIRFFVFDDDPIADELAQPIADVLRESDFNFAPTMRKILGSQIFYSSRSIGRKIKSPVELAIGSLRFFQASVNLQQMTGRLERLGQLPLYPPNVKGWEGGRTWVNAATILARANLIQEIFQDRATRFEAGSLADWLKRHRDFGVGDATEWLDEFLLAAELPDHFRATLQRQFDDNPATGLACLAAMPEFQLN